MATLINLQGGPQNFIDRLDFIIDNVRNTSTASCDEVSLTESSGVL